MQSKRLPYASKGNFFDKIPLHIQLLAQKTQIPAEQVWFYFNHEESRYYSVILVLQDYLANAPAQRHPFLSLKDALGYSHQQCLALRLAFPLIQGKQMGIEAIANMNADQLVNFEEYLRSLSPLQMTKMGNGIRS